MRQDLFRHRKSIHIKLDKETHAALRQTLFAHSVTMQDIFEEFAEILLKDEKRAKVVIARVVEKKLKAELDGLKNKKQTSRPMGEMDSETLYNLLERNEKADDDLQL